MGFGETVAEFTVEQTEIEVAHLTFQAPRFAEYLLFLFSDQLHVPFTFEVCHESGFAFDSDDIQLLGFPDTVRP